MKDITLQIASSNSELTRVATALARDRVTLRAGVIVNTGRHFVTRFIPSNLDAARDALESAGVRFGEGEIVPIRLEARPGELVRLISKLAAGGVGLRAIYVTSMSEHHLEIAVAPTNVARAMLALR